MLLLSRTQGVTQWEYPAELFVHNVLRSSPLALDSDYDAKTIYFTTLTSLPTVILQASCGGRR